MFTWIIPPPFRKRIRKRQRKGFRYITEKQNFIHKEVFSKSFFTTTGTTMTTGRTGATEDVTKWHTTGTTKSLLPTCFFRKLKEPSRQLFNWTRTNFSTRQLFASDQLELYEKGFYRSFVFASQDFANIHVFPITKTYRHLNYSDLP